MNYNGTIYHYVYNLQGDVIALLDDSNSIVVEYKYDAWGALLGKTGSLASTLGTLNPFRYRGYVYDEETKLYYLRSRYYNPEWGRFISADALLGKTGALLDHNLFAYCGNNPVTHDDPYGYDAQDLEGGASAGGIILAALLMSACQIHYISTQRAKNQTKSYVEASSERVAQRNESSEFVVYYLYNISEGPSDVR